MLGGGDLDGDIYCLVMDKRLHTPKKYPPADYKPADLVELDRPATIKDIAQFVVDYIKVRFNKYIISSTNYTPVV